VPADPSSPIPAALTRLAHADPRQFQDAEAPYLLAYLAAVPDPRGARGRRHPLVAILAIAAAAVLAGARSIAAIAEWAADAPQPVRAAVGARRDAPGHFAVPGRIELRTLKAVTVGRFGFPHAAQVLQVTRKTRSLDASPRRFKTVMVYAVTSLPSSRPARPGSPTGCAGTGRSRHCTTSAT
jgi:DDE family transposase